MITLDAATKSLEIRLGSAANTSQPEFVVAYTDIGQVNQQVVSMAESDGVTNDATAVTLLAAPDAGNSRVVRFLSVFNADDADAEVRISVNNNSTIREVLWITLTPNQTLEFSQGQWGVINVAGDFQPLSTKLTSLALLDGGADKLPYFSGENTFSQTDFTAFARGFIALTEEPYREILTADVDFYVNASTGSDAYDGLSPTDDGGGVGPFATIQAGIDAVAMHDLSIYDATINVADGTYPDAIVLQTLVGAGTCFIVGNTGTPANVLIDGTTHCMTGEYFGRYEVSGVKMQTSAGNAFLITGPGASLTFEDVEFGTVPGVHVLALSSTIESLGAYTISGDASRHMRSAAGGYVRKFSGSVTLTGTPDFSTAFVQADRMAIAEINSSNVTFTGSATGKRYDVITNSLIDTNGGGATYLPGDAAGTDATGGVYA